MGSCETRIIVFNGKTFLFNKSDHSFICLSNKVVEIYEALQRRIAAPLLQTYLCQKYDIDFATAKGWIEQATNLLFQKGYII
jgi:hypothetical protein